MLTLGKAKNVDLSGADHVFYLSSHWNPHKDAEVRNAVFGSHLLKDVTIHQFVTINTVEARILQIQEKKLEEGKMIVDPGYHNRLSREELQTVITPFLDPDSP